MMTRRLFVAATLMLLVLALPMAAEGEQGGTLRNGV